jgi:hypothetical protein
MTHSNALQVRVLAFALLACIFPIGCSTDEDAATPSGSTDAKILPGTYQHTDENIPITGFGLTGNGNVRGTSLFNADESYLQRYYLTSAKDGRTDVLVRETSGSVFQRNDTLFTSNRRNRFYDLDSDTWSEWNGPFLNEVGSKVRNIKALSFEIGSTDSSGTLVWRIWTRI